MPIRDSLLVEVPYNDVRGHSLLLMRHADIRTTMNIYGSVVTDEMEVASAKVAGLALRAAN